MAGLLHKLENNEAVLLMYLAGELPAEDRAEVEDLLKHDGALRRAMEQLRELNGQVESGLASLAEPVRSDSDEQVAVRRISRAMVNVRARRLAEVPAAEVVHTEHRLRWYHPLVGVAAAVIIFLAWWGNSPTTMLDDSWKDSGNELVFSQEPDNALETAERHAVALLDGNLSQSAVWNFQEEP